MDESTLRKGSFVRQGGEGVPLPVLPRITASCARVIVSGEVEAVSFLKNLFGPRTRESDGPSVEPKSPPAQAAGKAPAPVATPEIKTPPVSAPPPSASTAPTLTPVKAPTNFANWWFDLPEPLQGRSESKTPIQLDLTQKTVNTIGAAYKTLHNWKTVVGPDQVFISCDVPLDVDSAAFKAAKKNPGIAFTGAHSPSPLMRFGLLTWEQCCQWKLDTLGIKESDSAAQTRNKRISDGLTYELKLHVEELINIGRQTDGYWVSGRFLDPAQPRSREIGEHLNHLGRRRMMLAVHAAVRGKLGDYAARELEVAWNGIGDWEA